ncbi:MAG: hypothetical protein ABIK83_06475 [Candidatus Zixiibacteriota bacterium]
MFQKTLNRRALSRWIWLFAAVLMLTLAGCGDDSLVGGDGNDDQVINFDGNLRITNFMYEVGDTIYQNHSVVVSGWVRDSLSNPATGITVYYYAEPVGQGYFSKAVDTTRLDGSFSTGYYPVNPGPVTIFAQIAEDKLTAKSKTVEISGGTPGDDTPDYTFEFFAPEGFVLADGENEVEILLVVHTGPGEPAENGTVVKLCAGERFEDVDGNGYFTENVDNVEWDANENEIWDRIGVVPAAVTTSDSTAIFTYTAGTTSGLVFIRATIGEGSNSIYGEFALSLRPSEDVAYIKLSAAYPEMQVKATGGIESTNLIAYCYDRFGNPVQQDIGVEFFIVSGPNGGESIQNEGTGPVIAYTNVLGAAMVTLLSGTVSGTITSQAKVGTVYSDAVLVDVNAGPPDHLSVGVAPCNVRGCGWINVTADVIVLVEDMYDNPVMDSTAVAFTTNTIGMIDALSLTVDGIAQSVFRSTNECLDGRAWITAETDGGRVKDSTFLIVSGLPAYINIYSYPQWLSADGRDAGNFYVTVLDANDNFVVNGQSMKYDFWPEGSAVGSGTSNGCNASVAVGELTSAVLTKDYSYSVPDDGIGANGVLTATVGDGAGISHSVTVELRTGYSYTDNCEVKIASKVAPGSSEPLSVLIKDRSGNPLSGHAITAIASTGTITPGPIYTNEYGEAVGFTYTAPGAIGNAYITVTDADPRGGLIITQKIKIEYDN